MLTIAMQELKMMLRNKWVFSFGALFSILAIIIVYFGGTGQQAGIEGFNRMTASLLNLSLFLVPLLTLLIGSTSLAGDKEDGGFTLLLTYPIPLFHVFLGKFIGLFLSLFTVISFGYGMAGIILFIQNIGVSYTFLLLFYVFTLLLAMMFLAISLLIGVISFNRFQALGLSLFIWALTVLFYEFIVMGLTMVVPKGTTVLLLTISILLNPVELVRVWTIIAMDSASIFGPHLYKLTIWSQGVTGQLSFVISALAWTAIPLLLSIFLTKRGV